MIHGIEGLSYGWIPMLIDLNGYFFYHQKAIEDRLHQEDKLQTKEQRSRSRKFRMSESQSELRELGREMDADRTVSTFVLEATTTFVRATEFLHALKGILHTRTEILSTAIEKLESMPPSAPRIHALQLVTAEFMMLVEDVYEFYAHHLVSLHGPRLHNDFQEKMNDLARMMGPEMVAMIKWQSEAGLQIDIGAGVGDRESWEGVYRIKKGTKMRKKCSMCCEGFDWSYLLRNR